VNGTVLDFGTSGLLRFSNLVMYDRQTHSWWQEFSGEAIVGEMTGHKLELLALEIVPWKEFKAAFPQGQVLSRRTGHSRPYGLNPYVLYDTSDPFLFEGPRDVRLPPTERVVGIDKSDLSIAVPYSVLEERRVVHLSLAGEELVVFFKKGATSSLDNRSIKSGRDVGAVGVFSPHLDGQRLTFQPHGEEIMDEQTGSTWTLLGRAESGPLAGRQLDSVVHRAGSFWFSWVTYRPDTLIYRLQ